MTFPHFLRRLPERLATGAYVLHTGIEKWSGDEERAAGVHAMAAGAYPFLGKLKPTTFLKLLSVGRDDDRCSAAGPVRTTGRSPVRR